MKLFTTIQDSIYNPAFYQAEKNGSAKKAVAYFCKLKVIQAVIVVIIMALFAIPMVTAVFSQKNIQTLINKFPAELQLTLKNGILSTNVPEPYSIPFQPGKNDVGPHPANFVVIDTKAAFTPDLFEKSDTFILLTKEQLIGKKENGQITIQPLESFPDAVIDRTQLTKWSTDILSFFTPTMIFFIVLAILIIGILLNFIVLSASHLFLNLIASFVVWVILKIQKTPFEFGQVYKLGLYAVTSIVILHVLSVLVGFPALSSISLIVLFTVLYVNIQKGQTATAVSQDQPLP